jgi:hypothetical protein
MIAGMNERLTDEKLGEQARAQGTNAFTRSFKMGCRLLMLMLCVEENGLFALDQTDYQRRYTMLTERYESIKEQIELLDNEKRD